MFKLVFKQVSVGVVLGVAALSAHAADITGAGASFPYPIYAKWASDYKAATGNTVNYQSIGSGGGQKQIIAKTVDFGASDDPMSGEDLAKNGLVQFPAVIGGIVPVVNLQGIQPGQLKFTGALLADIYLGKVKKWNDEAIAKLNPGVNLPAADIIVVHRSDGSGTTFGWTNYLSKVSADWKSSVGEGKAVKWPAGQGGKGNEGVANYVKQFPGAIGYVEYAYAKQNKLAHGQVQNKDGKFVQPEEAAFAAAAANADWKSAPGMGVILNNEPGEKSWPITSATFILMHKAQDKPTQGAEVLKFFDWAFKNGKKSASELDYVALPDAVTTQIRSLWKSDIKDASGKSLY
ncbi:phosphate ABC transporter substrate-binding protein PstS [Pigmentiphaga sp. GD03639]|nr:MULTISPECIES: phosphate ABC transporter substrate-binding protein PstS [unclassified Pigmentiphaga]MDH2239163.1 phosphate ABC transporter substrate-binding protein PstS [Pigmentiphaga sp. GD03639]OVZ62355.1 phosphate ABC transporter substrate-binding protein PstS [Pigmentiphaga sp. NML030171]